MCGTKRKNAFANIACESREAKGAERDVVFLDKELADLTASIDGPEQRADVLARIPMKRGEDLWLVLHVEIQGPRGGDLPERMFFNNSSLRVAAFGEPAR